MEVLKFIFCVMVAILAWKYVAIPTKLDATRDQLFDLRDDLRAHFLSKGWDISSRAYGDARATINGYLRFVDVLTFWRLFYLHFHISRNPAKYGVRSKRKPDAEVHSEIERYTNELKSKALKVVMAHAVSTSFVLHLISFVLAPFFLLSGLLNAAKAGIGDIVTKVSYGLRHLPGVFSFGWSLSEEYVGQRFFKASVVEQISTRYAFNH